MFLRIIFANHFHTDRLYLKINNLLSELFYAFIEHITDLFIIFAGVEVWHVKMFKPNNYEQDSLCESQRPV